jgi:AraC-like DNA-binding protein
MKKSTHFYSLNSEWQHELIHEEEGADLRKEVVILPQTLGHGHTYYTEIITGVSVLFFDFTLTNPIKVSNIKSDDFFIFHFDLSEKINLIKINNTTYKTGSIPSLALAILNGDVKSSFRPATGERTLVLRLFIDKKNLREFFKNYPNESFNLQNIKINKKPFRYYSNIDSNSILLIESLKKTSCTDISFDTYLKGISLKLLGNFLSRYSKLKNEESKMSNIEKKAIRKTKEYLLKNLRGSFPSIDFLSKLAGISPSRYIVLFKSRYLVTPNIFFNREKMLLSNKLLKSGNYNSITEIIQELNYDRLNYFSSKYYAFFKRKPADDFIKKNN